MLPADEEEEGDIMQSDSKCLATLLLIRNIQKAKRAKMLRSPSSRKVLGLDAKSTRKDRNKGRIPIVTEILDDGSEGETKIRPAGTYVMSKGGEAHMEKGGPNGATVFFALHSVEGTVFETLDKDMKVLDASTVAATATTSTASPCTTSVSR